MDDLLPVEHVKQQAGFRSKHVPIESFMCHIPNIHKDLQVLSAISSCEHLEIFTNDGCCAIINWMWAGQLWTARFRMLLATVELINFIVINFSEGPPDMVSKKAGNNKNINFWSSLVILFLAVLFELTQIMGYCKYRLMDRYFATFRHWFDMIVLTMTMIFIVVFFTIVEIVPEDETSDLVLMSLGVIIYLKWFRLLTWLRQFEAIGCHILPIMSTTLKVGPFLIVLGVYVLASWNLYFAVQHGYTWNECLMLMYRLAVLGDFDLQELEHKKSPPTTLHMQNDMKQGSISTAGSMLGYGSVNWHSVRITFVLVSFMVGVLIMNLFIAVLCSEYEKAAAIAKESFMRSRARIVLDQAAVNVGWRICNKLARKALMKQNLPRDDERVEMGIERGLSRHFSSHSIDLLYESESTKDLNARSMQLDEPQALRSFLWYVKQAPDGD